ncbi:MAG TPA: hypothetical protein VD833_03025 [Vicinamibacterales bacterium]|nr:hypothetical protein [Vicinamibacterales bacterium]
MDPVLRRLPWGRILGVLAAAAGVAWVVGYLAGLIVRFFWSMP